MDDNLLTTKTLEDDWEENLQAKARGEIPSEEDKEEPEPVKTIITKEFSEQLLGMRDYAHRLDNAEMLDLLNNSSIIGVNTDFKAEASQHQGILQTLKFP